MPRGNSICTGNFIIQMRANSLEVKKRSEFHPVPSPNKNPQGYHRNQITKDLEGLVESTGKHSPTFCRRLKKLPPERLPLLNVSPHPRGYTGEGNDRKESDANPPSQAYAPCIHNMSFANSSHLPTRHAIVVVIPSSVASFQLLIFSARAASDLTSA